MRRHRSLLGLMVGLAVLLAATPVEAAEPARVLLQMQTGGPNGSIRVTATVLDARGTRVADAPVTFRVRTTFGWLTVAEVSTGKDGRAHATVSATNAGEITVEAGDEGTTRAAMLIAERRWIPPRVRPGRDVLSGLSPQPGFISPYPVPLQVMFLGLILAGVWSAYGYVVWLLVSIRREHQGKPGFDEHH